MWVCLLSPFREQGSNEIKFQNSAGNLLIILLSKQLSQHRKPMDFTDPKMSVLSNRQCGLGEPAMDTI